MKVVPAKHFTKADRGLDDVTLIVVHTAECGETSKAAENLQSWTAGANASKASWHYAVDNDSITQSVREEDVAWHAGPVNGYSIGIEHAGYASQTDEQWADDFSIAMLERSAELVADICRRRGIPILRLTAADLAAGKRSGICGHVDVTRGLTGGKGHTDPGEHFPWQYFLERVAAFAGVEAEPITQPSVPQLDMTRFVPVECDGVMWMVYPIYIAPVSIGRAKEIADELGCELPSPRLVDAIWRAADLRIDATKMIRSHDGTPKTMDSPATHEDQGRRLGALMGNRSQGVDFQLLAGAYKDVVVQDGKIGLYGWHRADGSVIQGFFSGHSAAHRDYSQGLRLVRRQS